MRKVNAGLIVLAVWFFTCVMLAIAAQGQIAPKVGEPRIVNIVGDIKADMAVRIVNQLKQLDKENNQEITINITSYGGEVYAALQIIDEMKAVKSPVHTVCEGYCMSAAAFILSSGSKGLREAMPNATVMVHQVSSDIRGNISEMKQELAEADRLQGIVYKILEQDTGLGFDQLQLLLSFDNFMSPEQAVKCGLIDNVKAGAK